MHYKKFVKSLTKQGYKINPYDGFVANKVAEGKQVTTCFHIDDCKISHKSSAVIDDTIAWLRGGYESIFEDGLGQMKVHRGKTHKYFFPLMTARSLTNPLQLLMILLLGLELSIRVYLRMAWGK